MVELSLDSGMYQAKLKAQLVFVNQHDESWNYSMKIVDYMDTYESYLQIIYDRIPVLPQEVKKDSGSFEDLKLNTQKRVTSPFYQKRQYPRILLNVKVPTEIVDNGKRMMVHLWDFNYCYVSLKGRGLPKEFTLYLTQRLALHCVFENDIHDSEHLYAVTNGETLARSPETSDELLAWVSRMNKDAVQRASAKRPARRVQKSAASGKMEDFDEKDLV